MPKRQVLIAAVCLLGGMASAAFGVFLAVNPTWLPVTSSAVERHLPPPSVEKAVQAAVSPAKVEQPPERAVPAFDFLRLAPPGGGVSVLAGRGRPKSVVTIYENGKPIGTTEVDANGEWSMVTEYTFAAGDPQLTVQEGRPASPAPQVAAVTPVRPDPLPRNVTAVENEVVRKLETALKEARKQIPAPEIPLPPIASARVASAERGAGALPTIATPEPVITTPVPITFVYREARPTPLGEKAAQLLIEYVKLKSVQALELTGHADERGTDEFNMQLSRARLETVAQLLRSGGFDGRLTLVPRGRAEPYQGIDRSRLSLDDLYQLDRRVELRAAR